MRNLIIIAAALFVVACGREEARERETPPPTASAPATPDAGAASAAPVSVELQPASGSSVNGTLTLAHDEQAQGVTVRGTINGLEPNSTHGFHIHENGDCSAPDASSAGEHFNPTAQPHGGPGLASHVGDLGNITADAQGSASVDTLAPQAVLAGNAPTSVRGKAILVHASQDDLTTQPSGNSGARIACGVIP